MAGKSKNQKKMRAKTANKLRQEDNRLRNLATKKKETKAALLETIAKQADTSKIVADQETDVLGNNAEPIPAEINEDAQKDRLMDEAAVKPMDKPFDINAFVANTVQKAKEE